MNVRIRTAATRSFPLLFACLGSIAPLEPAHAISSETFVLAVGGDSQVGPHLSCTTFAPATPALAFFSNVSPAIPTDGLATCGIAGGFRTTTIPTAGPISDSTSLTTGWNGGANSATSSAVALARSGSVLAEAHGSFAGSSNSLTVRGAASYGLFVDSLTASSPSVSASTPGTIRLRFTVGGVVSVAGPPPFSSVSDVELNYSVAGGPSFILMRAQATSADQVPFAVAGTGAPLVGFTAIPGRFSGTGTIDSFDLPIVWNTPFDLKFGILASVIPSTGATAVVDFTQGATLTGIQLFANGQPVQNFTITAASGTAYGPNGVPEPGIASMLPLGALALAFARRSKRATL